MAKRKSCEVKPTEEKPVVKKLPWCKKVCAFIKKLFKIQ